MTSLGLLDKLLRLPVGLPVPRAALGGAVPESLAHAPHGVVEATASEIVRLLVAPVRVSRVLVHSPSWRTGLRRVAAFEAFAERVLILEREPRGGLGPRLWEADCAGVGVWVSRGGGRLEEVLAPAPGPAQQIKAAQWAFRERAYATWLRAGAASCEPAAPRARGS